METPVFNFLKNLADFTSEELEILQDIFIVEPVKKNEIILEAGQICDALYLVSEGILRSFHTTESGAEFTRLIVSENQFCTILISFQERIPSPAYIQALENGVVFKVSRSHFYKFLDYSENAKRLYTKILEDFQNFQIKRLEFLTQNTPTQKTEIFLRENSNLEKRLTDKVIATYLQITPETYSRCKKILKT